MTQVQLAPDTSSRRTRRRVLILLGVVAVGAALIAYRVFSWDPNYVINVIDANKLILNGDEGALVCCVDSPPYMETVVGAPAVAFTRQCILRKHIRLELAEKPKDETTWTLGYIFYKDASGEERFLNEELLRRGYGRLVLAFPNLKYRKVLEAAEAEAKAKKLGVWAPGYVPSTK